MNAIEKRKQIKNYEYITSYANEMFDNFPGFWAIVDDEKVIRAAAELSNLIDNVNRGDLVSKAALYYFISKVTVKPIILAAYGE